MMTAVAIVVVLALPVTVLVGLLRLANALEQRRAQAVARQIALTDAIHASLGPVVAPFVRRGRRGAWVGVLAVPPGHPQIGLMVEIARAELGPAAEIVLVTPEPFPTRPRRAPAPPALTLSGAASG
jgi:hypothetical protein